MDFAQAHSAFALLLWTLNFAWFYRLFSTQTAKWTDGVANGRSSSYTRVHRNIRCKQLANVNKSVWNKNIATLRTEPRALHDWQRYPTASRVNRGDSGRGSESESVRGSGRGRGRQVEVDRAFSCGSAKAGSHSDYRFRLPVFPLPFALCMWMKRKQENSTIWPKNKC